MKTQIQEYEGKFIKVFLNSGKIFTGKVEEIVFIGTNQENVNIFLFTIKDKFGLFNSFANYEIKQLEEINPEKKEKTVTQSNTKLLMTIYAHMNEHASLTITYPEIQKIIENLENTGEEKNVNILP